MRVSEKTYRLDTFSHSNSVQYEEKSLPFFEVSSFLFSKMNNFISDIHLVLAKQILVSFFCFP